MPGSVPLALPDELERRARRVAFVEALVEADESMRMFHFDPRWSRTERLFRVTSGEGDEVFITFSAKGAFLRGRSSAKKPVPHAKLFAGVPRAFAACLREPAFDVGGDSFAAWCERGQRAWAAATDVRAGGLAPLVRVLDGDAKSLASHVRRYYERGISSRALAMLYAGAPISPQWVADIDAVTDAGEALALAKTLGLPVVRGPSPMSTKKSAARSSSRSSGPITGDAEFKVVRDGDTAMLVVANKVQMKATRAGLYVELIEAVRAGLRGAGATG